MTAPNTTVDHDAIKAWVEVRGGTPAMSGDALRIAYDELGASELVRPISWDEWFRVFEEQHLAFLHRDEDDGGELSRFSELVDRERDHHKHTGRSDHGR
jgi:hypothetical protein